MSDPIIQELWETKDAIARENQYDMRKLVHGLREEEKNSNAKIVDLSQSRKEETPKS
jgi:hypothetical protein